MLRGVVNFRRIPSRGCAGPCGEPPEAELPPAVRPPYRSAQCRPKIVCGSAPGSFPKRKDPVFFALQKTLSIFLRFLPRFLISLEQFDRESKHLLEDLVFKELGMNGIVNMIEVPASLLHSVGLDRLVVDTADAYADSQFCGVCSNLALPRFRFSADERKWCLPATVLQCLTPFAGVFKSYCSNACFGMRTVKRQSGAEPRSGNFLLRSRSTRELQTGLNGHCRRSRLCRSQTLKSMFV